jgi:DNA mismatch repair protein MutL
VIGMSVIKVLDEILANKIAAGEVVERCSSVVKELVENSIDAGSTEIKVELQESGVKEIKVIDNGKGMDEEDAVTCFSRHATSKIYHEEDLYRIGTLGFRGEALASIASVSKVTLTTSTGNIGTVVEINGGKIISISKGDSRKGTIISVRDLFYNTPARLKHLKSLYAELANITDYMNKLALSHPNIRFSLSNDSKLLFKTDGNGNLLKTIRDIYGLDTAKKMLEINANNDDYEISGFISLPEVNKSSRNSIVTLVNGRIVRNSELNRWINEGYHSLKPDNRYPVVVLNITVDTSIVDVNIHPTKMDIKFGKQEELNELVYQTIKNKLKEKTLIPHIETKKVEVKVEVPKPKYETFTLDFDSIAEPENEYAKEEVIIPINEDVVEEVEIHEDVKERLPLLYPVGLVHGTYIIAQNETGMYLIDQHAAKERINYEMVKKKLFDDRKEIIPLLIPVTIEYSTGEFLILKENFELIESLGFKIEEFGINSIVVKEHPIWLPEYNYQENIKRVFEMILEKEKNFDIKRFYDNLSATVACKMSIKANTNITLEEMEHLINDLRECDNPFNCPHGRPTVIYYSKADLEKMFKRSGF